MKWLKNIFLWFFIKENRMMGIKYTKMTLDIARMATKITATKKDDIAVGLLLKNFIRVTSYMDETQLKEMTKNVTEAKGSIKGLKMSIDSKKGIELRMGNNVAGYDFKDKSIKIGTIIKF